MYLVLESCLCLSPFCQCIQERDETEMRSVELSMKRDSKEAEAVKKVFPSALDMLGKGRGGCDRARP